MTVSFQKGQYGVRFAATENDVQDCQALRHRCFFGSDGLDQDAFDANCRHAMIANETGLVATFRMQQIDSASLCRSYAAGAYDLARLADYSHNMLELGRFCILPGAAQADVMRLAWGLLAQVVDDAQIGLIFGCTSFPGTDPAPYSDAFAFLAARHVAPVTMLPGKGADETVPFPDHATDRRRAIEQLPPLLRSYLSMGGWVSDHAVIDHQMNRLHVFTGLEVARISPARARALRAIVP